MATAAVAQSAPPCPECRGGGEINGVPCRPCGGKGRQPGRLRARGRMWRALNGLAHKAVWPVGAGVRALPGVVGAAGVVAGWAACMHAIWGWIPWWGPVALLGGAFLLLLDRRL